ncbi:MAG: NAD-dependent epimerase/dehydratase family protein [Roseburia sp.]
MKKVLVTGGTTFVSKFVASYYVKKGYDVYVLNRNTKEQVKGVKLIRADRNALGDKLKNQKFDVVFDITSYTQKDAEYLVEALDEIKEYILISSSAVYPEDTKQPFRETQDIGYNTIWKDYGKNKIEAERYIQSKVPQAYILRPPYFYGPMENLYREPFVFDCALQNRKFYLPKDGSMKLQFFHVEDLCRFMDRLLEEKPKEHIFNVGNEETVTIRQWVELCYKAAGNEAQFVNVYEEKNQRDYFCFYDYEYVLDVSRQKKYLESTKDLYEGLVESFQWYLTHKDDVNRKDYITYIEENFVKNN